MLMQPLACSVCRICVVEKPRQTISPKRLVHLIVKSFLGKNTVEQRSTSNVRQCQGKKPRRWPEQLAFVSPSLPNGCAVLGTGASLEAATFSLRIFRPFCAMIRKQQLSHNIPCPHNCTLQQLGFRQLSDERVRPLPPRSRGSCSDRLLWTAVSK